MLIPIGPVKQIPITILHVSHDPPQVVEGRIVHFDGKVYSVVLKDTSISLSSDEQLLVDLGEGEQGRRRARVLGQEQGVWLLELLGRPRRRERREFPRIEGLLDLEYLLLPPDGRAALENWLRHPHLSEAGQVWVKPDPFMEFSMTGLRFASVTALQPGSLLCLRFRVPGREKQQFTSGGEVVRSEPDEAGGYFLAVAFTGLDEATCDALFEYTRRCQDILLGIDNMHDE